MRKRITAKLAAAALLLLVIGMIYYFLTGFFGNPISAAIAGYKIKGYVQEKYPDKDLNVSNPEYNFKSGSYYSVIQSKTIKDMRFYVSYKKGKFNDSFEHDVTGGYMTYCRLASEFDSKVEDIIKSSFKHKSEIVIADFIVRNDDFSMLTLDMPLDIENPPFDAYLTVYILTDEISYEALAARLLELSNLMQDSNIPISLYSLVIEEASPEGDKAAVVGNALHLFDFPAEKLQSNDLLAAIKEHIAEYEAKNPK